MLEVLRGEWSIRQKGIVLLLVRVLLCIAGAGAGKTTVLIERVAYFIRRGIVAAAHVYLVSFSRKAAAQLNSRVRKRTRVDVHASTIHALALAVILSSTPETAEDPDILDDRAQKRLIANILSDHPSRNTIETDAMVAHISRWKSHGFDAAAIGQLHPTDPKASIFAAYEIHKGKRLDFCDLIARATELLQSDPAVREDWHARVRLLAIDELQDTNPLELAFLKEIVAPETWVFAVGDPDQAIYGFQGADLTNILQFDRFFPGAVVLTLTENRRSSSSILGCAQSLIERNQSRYPKALTPTRSPGERAAIVEALNAQQEQEYVVTQMRAALAAGIEPAEIAVLGRTRAIVRSYAAFLKGQGVDVARHRYDQDFWTRPSVARAVALVGAVAGSAENGEWERLLGHLPQADRLSILCQALSQQRELQAVFEDGTLPTLTATARGREYAARLCGVIGHLRAQSLNRIGQAICSCAQPAGFLEGKGARAARATELDLQALAGTVSDMATHTDVVDFGTLHERLAGSLTVGDKVAVLTAHTAKGLEYEWVFVVGCEEGLFPHFYSLNTNAEDLEEERRLFYVAMTRAKDRLFLLHARRRWHGKANHRKSPSRFLSEIGNAEVVKIDACSAMKGDLECTSPSISTRR